MSEPGLNAQEARDLGARVLRGAGVEAGLAAKVAAALVENDGAGYGSHGLQRLPSYLDEMRTGALDPSACPVVTARDGAVLRIDGRRSFGVLVGELLVDALAGLAAGSGVAVACVTNCHHLGRLAPIGHHAAAAGLTLIGACNYNGGGCRVAPAPGLPAALSTNPLLVAVPVAGAAPFVLDMSTSTVAEGRIHAAALSGQTVPDGLLVSGTGAPCLQPGALYADPPAATMTPLGHPLAGHKGFGLALAVELLAGALAGAGHVAAPEPAGNGGLFIALRTDTLPRGGAAARVAADILHLASPRDAAGAPRWPGRARAGRACLAYPPALLATLRSLAASCPPSRPEKLP